MQKDGVTASEVRSSELLPWPQAPGAPGSTGLRCPSPGLAAGRDVLTCRCSLRAGKPDFGPKRLAGRRPRRPVLLFLWKTGRPAPPQRPARL